MFGAVAKVLLLLQDELRERQPVGHLNGSLLIPLEDEVVHGVANCRREETVAMAAPVLSLNPSISTQNKKNHR